MEELIKQAFECTRRIEMLLTKIDNDIAARKGDDQGLDFLED